MKLHGIIVVLTAVLSLPAAAGPSLESLNYVRFYGSSDPRVSYACENYNGEACHGSVAVPKTNWTANYEARGSGTYGVLKNYAAVTLDGDASGGAFPSFLSVGSRSGFIDEYTLSGGRGASTAFFTFSIDGVTASRNGAFGSHLLQYVPANDGVLDWGAQRNYGSVDGKAVVVVQFEYDKPFEMLLSFYALAQVTSWREGAMAMADFSHTAVLSQIEVRDSDGRLVKDFVISSASGTNYGANGVVPEPGSAVLLLTGLAAAGWLRRKRC